MIPQVIGAKLIIPLLGLFAVNGMASAVDLVHKIKDRPKIIKKWKPETLEDVKDYAEKHGYDYVESDWIERDIAEKLPEYIDRMSKKIDGHTWSLWDIIKQDDNLRVIITKNKIKVYHKYRTDSNESVHTFFRITNYKCPNKTCREDWNTINGRLYPGKRVDVNWGSWKKVWHVIKPSGCPMCDPSEWRFIESRRG